MPKYTDEKVYGCYLYFTSHCTLEAMHTHASDRKLTEKGSAKFFVKADGSTMVARKGRLKTRQIAGIQEYVKLNYLRMYAQWRASSVNGFYVGC